MDRNGTWVAVFGSSEAEEGEPLYEEARRLGALLAASGHGVVTGGYGGVMEAASRGAFEAGAMTLGVTCSIFPSRVPNAFLREELRTSDLFERTRALVEAADAYVVLRGKSGTLAELSLVWALHRAGTLPGRRVVLLGDAWVDLLRHLVRDGMIEPEQLQMTRAAASPEEAAAEADAAIAAGRGNVG
jgi:uncharacterized protein (TIGR00730 family)